MKNSRNTGFAFIAVAAAFLAIGFSTQKAFIGIAAVFLILGIAQIVKAK